MIGISVSASSFNVSHLIDSVQPMAPKQSANAADEEALSCQQSHACAAASDRDTLTELDAGNGDDSNCLSRRNSFSLMSINKVRRSRASYATYQPSLSSTVSTSRTTSIRSDPSRWDRIRSGNSGFEGYQNRAKVRSISTTSSYPDTFRTIARIDEVLDELPDDFRRPHSVSDCRNACPDLANCDTAMLEKQCDCEREQGENPLVSATAYATYPSSHDMLIDNVYEADRVPQVSICNRVVVALFSTVSVVLFCFVCGIMLCEIEVSSTSSSTLPQIDQSRKTAVLQLLNCVVNQSFNASHYEALKILLQDMLDDLSLRETADQQALPPDYFTYTSSFYIVWTAITTIGYGNLVPISWQGKLFTMTVALVGIPLFLINATHLANLTICAFNQLGYRLRLFVKALCNKEIHFARFSQAVCAGFLPKRAGPAVRHAHVVHLPLSISPAFLLICPLITLVISFAFWLFERDKDLIDILYFGYTTLLAIGFGDITLDAKNSWAIYLLGPFMIAGIGLYAYMAEMLRLFYLDGAHKLYKLYRHLCRRLRPASQKCMRKIDSLSY